MSAILLDCSHPPRVRVKVGDVLMVHKWIEKPKNGGNPFMWRFLGTVVKTVGTRGARVIRFGGDPGKDEVTIGFGGPNEHNEGVWFIPEDEWPDGVHAFRTRLILEGRIDEAVFGG